ncbi:MAG: DUF1847 domain-containing protein [Chloroflexi bacterium]|nr:DUF1847 domain-containing protein [Chloroflexota bacterium]
MAETIKNFLPQCAKCIKRVCSSENINKAPDNCPSKTQQKIIESALKKYDDTRYAEFARNASLQEAECYMKLPEGTTMIYPRVEETVLFAKKMGYKKLGLAFCLGLSKEAGTFTGILENNGFEVVSVCCKCGGIDKERIGIKPEQKINKSGKWETMCNPITQADLLNNAKTEFNIVIGLCVGHDALFLKHIEGLTTVLIAKDRVLGHNPAACLYTGGPYYKRLFDKK